MLYYLYANEKDYGIFNFPLFSKIIGRPTIHKTDIIEFLQDPGVPFLIFYPHWIWATHL